MKNLVSTKIGSILFATSAFLASSIVSSQPVGFASLNGGTTGGAGGQVVRASTGTQIHEALCGRSSNSTPIIIQVEGTINHGNTSKVSGSCNTAADKIEIKDVSNITIVGVGSGALFDQLGIHIRNASNIILQNLHVRNVKKSGSPVSNGGDAIGMETNVRNVWVDHVTLEASGDEGDGYDALFDIKASTQYVTLSYSILRNSGRGGLVGSSDDDTDNGPITFHHNYYKNLDSRVPLLRSATAHSFNNYYDGINKSGLNSRLGSSIKVENNHFENAKDPLGTFYTNEQGYWEVSGNIWGSGVTWTSEGNENYPAGPNPSSTTSVQTSYSYSLDAASCVKQIVMQTAGANKNLATSNGSCNVSNTPTPTPTPVVTPPPGSSTPTPTPGPNPTGDNLAIDAGSDGSSKASGSSYGNVRDGDSGSYWSPKSSSGERISIKWSSATNFSTVIIREQNGATTSWRLVNNDTGQELASGSSLGSERVISLGSVSMKKVNLMIDSANSAPQITEFEVY